MSPIGLASPMMNVSVSLAARRRGAQSRVRRAGPREGCCGRTISSTARRAARRMLWASGWPGCGDGPAGRG
eukprot:4371310-Prymnesium_polylepis.1